MKFTSVSYNPNYKVNCINILPICKNMSQQRMGRVGRVSSGVYIPLITYNNFNSLMNYRENLIQISDIKSTAFSLGYDMLMSLSFLRTIPAESIIDALQGVSYVG